ncbi:MAG: hypothetical protein M3R44_04160 [Candidatus Eremiobacteraeota bacterium]|nr:hypothetical protein [Candidatus Eremiobacteraeota bacterium]
MEGRVYVLGGNASTLAFVSSLRPQKGQVTAYLVPLAWTPAGVTLGEGWQRVSLAADNIGGWVDSTFAPEDERAFVTPLRDLEMLLRVGWEDAVPEALSEKQLVNPEDVPEDVLDGLDRPLAALTQCAVCRRMCVRDDFLWNERQLCAWDYHATVFGKRGPWRSEPYEERFFATLPRASYIAPGLLGELDVVPVLAVAGFPEEKMHRLVNLAIEDGEGAAFLGVRTDEGITVLREQAAANPNA